MPRTRTTPVTLPPLPRIEPAVADAIKEHLMTAYDIFRPPEVSAAMLALIVELERAGEPFPNRHRVAKHLNCSVFGLDAALATALNRELITLEVKVISGNIKARQGVRHERYFHPSKDLLDVARRARRRVA